MDAVHALIANFADSGAEPPAQRANRKGQQ
jgi:hypothetical protein